MEEIQEVVFHMDKEKAPNLDGFTLAFYQDHWNIIKDNLLKVFSKFHNNGVINNSTNVTFIVLVPKRSQTKKIFDFRPISLASSLYKFIVKVLSHCLQGGFAGDRS